MPAVSANTLQLENTAHIAMSIINYRTICDYTACCINHNVILLQHTVTSRWLDQIAPAVRDRMTSLNFVDILGYQEMGNAFYFYQLQALKVSQYAQQITKCKFVCLPHSIAGLEFLVFLVNACCR